IIRYLFESLSIPSELSSYRMFMLSDPLYANEYSTPSFPDPLPATEIVSHHFTPSFSCFSADDDLASSRELSAPLSLLSALFTLSFSFFSTCACDELTKQANRIQGN